MDSDMNLSRIATLTFLLFPFFFFLPRTANDRAYTELFVKTFAWAWYAIAPQLWRKIHSSRGQISGSVPLYDQNTPWLGLTDDCRAGRHRMIQNTLAGKDIWMFAEQEGSIHQSKEPKYILLHYFLLLARILLCIAWHRCDHCNWKTARFKLPHLLFFSGLAPR